MMADAVTQLAAATWYGIDERELRDYSAFIQGKGRIYPPIWQEILDKAYDEYCRWNAKWPFHDYIIMAAKAYGLKPRPIKEAWEVDPLFYPSQVKTNCLSKRKDGDERRTKDSFGCEIPP